MKRAMVDKDNKLSKATELPSRGSPSVKETIVTPHNAFSGVLVLQLKVANHLGKGINPSRP
jgi:hypothetical protein